MDNDKTIRPCSCTVERVCYHDLSDLEKIFTAAFGDEIHVKRIRQRIHRVRQFYYLLLPLSRVSPWVKNLFNIYVCRMDGQVAGFIQVSYLNRRQLHLDYIAVRKQYRGRGFGTLMLRKLVENVADAQQYDIILEVKEGNPAHCLYKRLGFTDQAKVLHFEKNIDKTSSARTQLPGFRVRRDTDWREIYQLYLASIPARIRRCIQREIKEFNPSLFTRTLSWIKNKLMGNEIGQYVLERDETIVGSLEIFSYPKAGIHSVSVLLHPAYEHLRTELMEQALAQLSSFGEGVVTTTIYNDDIRKQHTLAMLGFTKTETYYLMFRPPFSEQAKVVVYPVSKAHTRKRKSHPETLSLTEGE